MKVALAILESDDGKMRVIACSNDCQSVINAYKAFDGAGKVHLCDIVHFDRSKRIASSPKVQKAPKVQKHEKQILT